MDQEPIILASDHAGFEMKQHVAQILSAREIPFHDEGALTLDSDDDYPLRIAAAAKKVSRGEFSRGIVMCGAGIGASIVANKFRGVRAALCVTPQMAELSRRHNDANVLVLGGRITSFEDAEKIIDTWCNTPFEGGRHLRRINQIDGIPHSGDPS